MIHRLDRLGSHRIGVGDVIGPYRVISVGPDGYHAKHVRNDHEVRLDVWSAAAGTEVHRTARQLAGLDHPGMLTIVEWGTLRDGPHWIASAHAGGKGLHEVLVGRTLRAERVATLVRDVSDVLRYAHVRGVRHGSLRPSSILMTGGEQPIVISGWSNVTKQSGPAEQRGVFEAPEAAYEAPADVYALGVIAFRAVTGMFPRGPTLGMPGAPPLLAKLIADMLNENPMHRPTADEVRDQIGRMLGEGQEELIEIRMDDLEEPTSRRITPRFGTPKWTPMGLAPTPARATPKDFSDESTPTPG